MSDDVPEDKGNHDLVSDGQGGVTLAGWRPWAHHGSGQVDTQAPSEARDGSLSSLVSAAVVSQAGFDSTAAGVWPTWYAALPVGCKAVLRASLRRLAAV